MRQKSQRHEETLRFSHDSVIIRLDSVHENLERTRAHTCEMKTYATGLRSNTDGRDRLSIHLSLQTTCALTWRCSGSGPQQCRPEIVLRVGPTPPPGTSAGSLHNTRPAAPGGNCRLFLEFARGAC